MITDQTDKQPAVTLAVRGKRLLRIAVKLCALGLIGMFAFSLLARHFFVAELLVNFQLQWFILLSIGTWVTSRLGMTWLTLLQGVAGVWTGVGLAWIYLPAVQPAGDAETIRIMSFNVYAVSDRVDLVEERISEVDPDVIAILEYDHHWHRRLAGLRETYSHHLLVPRWHGYGLAIFSKLPLEETEIVQLIPEITDTPMAVGRIRVGKQPLRLAALHSLSPTNSFRFELRNRQFKEVAQTLGRDSVPTIVMGDFNCTPASPYLRDFMAETGYRDSRQGFGYQPSWHCDIWPLQIPIDHAFVSPEVSVHRRWVADAAGSDHYPIIVEVSVKPSRQ